MSGQGRPHNSLAPFVSRFPSAVGSLFVACCFTAAAASSAEPDTRADVRLRLAWGGESKAWQGTMQITGGEIVSAIPLGLEADSPGSLVPLDATQIRVLARMPRSYESCDLQLKVEERATLRIELTAGKTPRVIELPVAKLLKGLQSFPLDDRDNRLVIQRAPGDALLVEIDRQPLIYTPKEKLSVRVTPNQTDLPANTVVTLQMAVLQGRTEVELATQSRELKTDARGQLGPEAFDWETPAAEGVYDVRFSLTPKRTLASLPTALVRTKPLLERRLQFVVLTEGSLPSPAAAAWQTELEIDPAAPRWWERLMRMPSIKNLPSFASGPVGDVRPGTKTHLNRTWVELGPKNWQAYPLSVARPGEPHLLEIEYPSDLRQTLGISVVEPNAAGQVVPIGLDSGIDIAEPSAGHTSQMERHRLIIWPQTKAPLVLLMNRRDDGTAVYGRIRLLSGPVGLEPLVPPDAAGGRSLMAFFDKPLIAEAFSADEAIDPVTTRNLDDWLTFYRAGKRMTEYLQHAGYNSAIVPALCDGSALYPSELVQSTSNYETGLFFESGQDPVRKDVLEMLFRLYSRAGLQLIPSVQFASPLPELETYLTLRPEEAVGIEPLGADGKSWITRTGTRRGQGPYYNPLDPRVRAALRRVVLEIADRYSQHASFGGIALYFGPESYLLLPDELAGCDDETLQRFTRETGTELRLQGATRAATIEANLGGPARKAWLAWRAEQITKFIAELQLDLQQRRPGAKLILTCHDLFTDRLTQQEIRPRLTTDAFPESPFLSHGLDLAAIRKLPNVIAPRPTRAVALPAPGIVPLLAQWNRSEELRGLFSASSAFHYHEPAELQLPSFDQLSPFGRDKTHTWFVAHISPAGAAARERFAQAIAADDCRLMIDGGWMPVMGQEEALKPLLETYRRLPAAAFQTMAAGDTRPSSVTLRTLNRDGALWFYAVNDSPWPTRLEIDFRAGATTTIEPLGLTRVPVIQPGANGLKYSLALEPYDLVGGKVIGGPATVEAWRTTPHPDVDAWLRNRIRETRLRANALRTPQPLAKLMNPGFEQPSAKGEIPGWVFNKRAGTVETTTAEKVTGGQGLLLSGAPAANGARPPVTWIRSEPFETPRTGRLTLTAMIRVADPKDQPTLRFAVQGWEGKQYYRRKNFGASENGVAAVPLTANWVRYRFPLNDLPLSGLTDLRVGFDLMAGGDVWIDDVQVFDLQFEDAERDELLKTIASAELQLDSGKHADCLRFLQSPWPIFLRQFTDLDPTRLAVQPKAGRTAPPVLPSSEPVVQESRGMLDKMRSSMPKWPFR